MKNLTKLKTIPFLEMAGLILILLELEKTQTGYSLTTKDSFPHRPRSERFRHQMKCKVENDPWGLSMGPCVLRSSGR